MTCVVGESNVLPRGHVGRVKTASNNNSNQNTELDKQDDSARVCAEGHTQVANHLTHLTNAERDLNSQTVWQVIHAQ